MKRNIEIGQAILLACLVLVAFSPALRAGFVDWDDVANLVNNPHFRGLGPRQLLWMFMDNYLAHYIPLTWLSYGLDYTLWGMNPAGYHLTNVLLHAGNTVLFFFVARDILDLREQPSGKRAVLDPLKKSAGLFAPLAAAALFGLHPLRVESVAWISERRDVLSGAFFLGSIAFYLRARAGPALLSFLAAVLARESTVTLAAVLVVLDVYPLRRLGGRVGWFGPEARAVWREKAPFFFVALFGSGLALWATVGTLGYDHNAAREWWAYIPRIAFSIQFYLEKTLLPFGLAPIYERSASWFHVGVVSALLTAALAWRRLPSLTACWACYLAIISPYLWTSAGVMISVSPTQDRFSYLSCLPWALLAAGGGRALWRGAPKARPAFAVAVIAVVAGLMTLTFRQSGVWKDTETLWRRTIAVSPKVSFPYPNLARILLARGENEQAADLYEKLSRLQQTPAARSFFRALAQEHRGEIDEAVALYRDTLMADEKFVDAYVRIGNILKSRGDWKGATDHYARALGFAVPNKEAHFGLGLALEARGDREGARKQWRIALDIDPSFGPAARRLGRAPYHSIHDGSGTSPVQGTAGARSSAPSGETAP